MEINIPDNQQLLRMLFNEQQKEQGFRLLMQKYGNNIYWHIRRIVVGREEAEDVQQLGDETKYETVEGWTHETTCIQSYSTERLDWVFAHRKQSADGIETPVNDIYGNNAWYTLQGIKITQSLSHGLYIHNGKKAMVK